MITACKGAQWSETYSITRNGIKCGYTRGSKYIKKFEQARIVWQNEHKANAVPINIDNLWGRWKYRTRSMGRDLYIRVTSHGDLYHGVKEYNGTINQSTLEDIIFKNISRLDDKTVHFETRWKLKGKKGCDYMYIESNLFLHRNGKLYLLVLNKEGYANNLPSPTIWHRVK